ncbi:MAG: MBL fold metallo-hydrolase [Lachnospiraceae bacterium]|nr:MBL fold metallo-hydrolase [Lachnospiraceae bacterium]
MRLTMLGTGNATVSRCYNTCFILTEDQKHLLVDAGGGNQIIGLLEKNHTPFTEIHDIFVTHEHVDHILGVVWLIRMIGQKINQGKYNGNLRIYCFEELAQKIQSIVEMTVQKKVWKHFGGRIQFVIVEHGQKLEIIDHPVQVFDIFSTKAKQFGFTMDIHGTKFTCVGDEPYNEADAEFVAGSDWLLHEAFCLYSEAEEFKPYEKHHSTVKDACILAEQLQIPNLLLYHTEEKNLENRKKLYMDEGQDYYHGNLMVPDDMESFVI